MRPILYLVILSFVLNSCNGAISQSTQTQTPEKLNERFFDIYGSQGPKQALEFVFSTNKWMIENQTSEVKIKLIDLTKQLGTYQGNEFISKKSIGENYVLYSFLIRYDRQPVRFLLIYYKPDNNWQLQNFQYDVNLDTELIEAASAYRLIENLPDNK
jgi:hypothetical protein